MSIQEKLEAAKQHLGKKYLLHPDNQVKRKTKFKKSDKALRAALGA